MPKLNYWISNDGDGSASLQVESTFEKAEKECDAQEEGWGENSAGQLELKIEDGKILFKETRWNSKLLKHVDKWIALKD